MNLVRDVLDKELLDREEQSMGRVDGLLMRVEKNSQPRITHIDIGSPALWDRVHPIAGGLARLMAEWWGPKRRTQVRIPWSRVETIDRDIKLDIAAKDTGAIDWEIWIARHIIERIPGSGDDEVSDGY